jgi:hypothetical protein
MFMQISDPIDITPIELPPNSGIVLHYDSTPIQGDAEVVARFNVTQTSQISLPQGVTMTGSIAIQSQGTMGPLQKK